MSKLLQSKVVFSDRGTVFLEEMINDWLIEATLAGDKIQIEKISVPGSSTMVLLYKIIDPAEEARIIEKYKEKQKRKTEKENYFRSSR